MPRLCAAAPVRLDFLYALAHLQRLIGARAEGLEETRMTLLHLHHDAKSFARQNTYRIEKVLGRIRTAFRLLHRGIVSAKLRRLRTEMLLRPDYDEMFPPERDVGKYPQRPLILGDKWDF
jgi:hypothetical protein